MTAWVAAAFFVLVGLVMLWGHLQGRSRVLMESRQLRQQKEELRLNPSDEQKKQGIREMDLRLRQRQFRHVGRVRSGAWLLAGGAVVFLVAMYQVARLENNRHRPKARSDSPQVRAARAATRARWSVAVSGAALGALLLAVSLTSSTPLANQTLEAGPVGNAGETVTAAADVASQSELLTNWPRFRGAEGSGVSAFTNVPAEWDMKTGMGIAWKVPMPASGHGSPIVWGDRVFLSGGDIRRPEVFCFGAQTGEILWRQAVTNVPGSPANPPEIPDGSGIAAATMATDGRRVYAFFANGDLAAFTLEGKLAWSKGFGALKNPYGHASSLATWKGRLIVQLDQGDSEEAKSRLYALDAHSGQIAWQQPRKVPASWATPMVFEGNDKAQVVALAVPWAISYSAVDGTELWRVECLNGEVLPSPVFATGMLFVVSPSEKLLAIRTDGQGDVTKTHVVWTADENIPDIASPVSNGELIFTLSSSGILTAFDAKDGKKQWEHDFEMEFHASPGLAANRLYLFSKNGTAIVTEAARQFRELFRTEMDDSFHASPAFIQGGIILRGTTNLWEIRQPKY